MSSHWPEWVIDAGFCRDGLLCFCPIENAGTDEESIVFGFSHLGDKCPGKLVGVVHEDGQEAVEAWCAENHDRIEAAR